MKVLSKSIIEEGKIQIEDWSEDYPETFSYGCTVVVFPIAKISSDKPFEPKKGKTFRCEFNFKTNEEAQQMVNLLIAGEKKLKDYQEFSSNKKEFDKYYVVKED